MARCAFSLSLSVNKKGEGPKCIWLRLSAAAKIIQTANGSNFSHTKKGRAVLCILHFFQDRGRQVQVKVVHPASRTNVLVAIDGGLCFFQAHAQVDRTHRGFACNTATVTLVLQNGKVNVLSKQVRSLGGKRASYWSYWLGLRLAGAINEVRGNGCTTQHLEHAR